MGMAFGLDAAIKLLESNGNMAKYYVGREVVVDLRRVLRGLQIDWIRKELCFGR